MTKAHEPPHGRPSEYVGTRTAAVQLGVTERTVLRWCEDGTLPVSWTTPGGHRRITPESVRQLAEQLAEADQDAAS